MVVDFDDFGCAHIISDMCRSNDCRDKLDALHYANPEFKATLFAIPGEMTAELCRWCKANSSWVELAVHGLFHTDNYECNAMAYDDIETAMKFFKPMLDEFFVKGFKAPGWQISDDWYRWLMDNGYWVADQAYNNGRRPENLPAYVNSNGSFTAHRVGLPAAEVQASHHHTWDCMGNGIYEQFDYLDNLVKSNSSFRFVSEVLSGNYN